MTAIANQAVNNSLTSFEIGNFIRETRQARNLTQIELAKLINSTQSSVARLEKGEQNLTTETLSKISNALNHKIISLAPKSIDFEVSGGKELSGSIETNYSKNGAMGLLCASLLNLGVTTLHGIPRIEEVNRILEVMSSIGVDCIWISKNTLQIKRPKKLKLENINIESASKTRTILMFIGSLIHEYEEFNLPHSQGCTLGTRTITPHLYGLEKFNITIKVTDNQYQVKNNNHDKSIENSDKTEIIMYEASDTGTELLMIAAAKFNKLVTIKYASSNYMVQDVGLFLQKLGVEVQNLGQSTMTIKGIPKIEKDVEFYNSEDPIESMMFISAAICTNSTLTITRCPIEFLELELLKLSKMGLKYQIANQYLSYNNWTKLVDLTVFPSTLTALADKITCGAYPDINMDNLPFFVPISTQASGQTLIHDWVYENRAIYFTELNRLGCQVNLADPHRVYIQGKTKFKPAQVVCPPALRPAMIILIGMLGADGVSILRNVYSIRRGYQEITERLNSIGANIKII